MSRAAGLSTGPRGGLSGVARTAGVPLIGVALTQTSPMTSADQMTSTLTSALATGYVNLRGEEDLYLKKRSGGEGALGLRFPLITGNSARGMAGVQPEALRGHGKAADPETNVSPGIPRTHVFEGAEKKGGTDTLWAHSIFSGAFTRSLHKGLFLLFLEERELRQLLALHSLEFAFGLLKKVCFSNLSLVFIFAV